MTGSGGCPCIPSKPGECTCGGDEDFEKLKQSTAKLRELSARISKDEDALEAIQQWLDDARTARKKLKRHIYTVNVTKTDLLDELNDLNDQKEMLKRKAKRDALERDLKMASDSLSKLAKRQEALGAKKDAIADETSKVEKSMSKVSTGLQKSIGTFEELARKIGVRPPHHHHKNKKLARAVAAGVAAGAAAAAAAAKGSSGSSGSAAGGASSSSGSTHSASSESHPSASSASAGSSSASSAAGSASSASSGSKSSKSSSSASSGSSSK